MGYWKTGRDNLSNPSKLYRANEMDGGITKEECAAAFFDEYEIHIHTKPHVHEVG